MRRGLFRENSTITLSGEGDHPGGWLGLYHHHATGSGRERERTRRETAESPVPHRGRRRGREQRGGRRGRETRIDRTTIIRSHKQPATDRRPPHNRERRAAGQRLRRGAGRGPDGKDDRPHDRDQKRNVGPIPAATTQDERENDSEQKAIHGDGPGKDDGTLRGN